MAKTAKKTVTNPGKPITAFFTKAAKTPSSPAAPLSSQNAPLLRTSSLATVENVHVDKQALAISNKTNGVVQKSASGSKEKAQSGAVSTRRSERRSLQPAPSITSALKRARTPDLQPVARKHTSGRVKTPERRKSKFDTDSESDPTAQEVIYVKSPNRQPVKKARLSSPAAPEPGPSNISSMDIVPSSQSDEEELPSAPPRFPIVTTASKGSTKHSTLPTPHPEDDNDSFAMAIDQGQHGPSTPSRVLPLPNSTRNYRQMITPPSSDRPDLPPTPVALTQAAKTAKIIADIKARAYARNVSSPEPLLDFQDELESSEDEDLPILPLQNRKASSSKEVEMRDETTSGPSTRRSSRISERLRSGSPPTTLPVLAPPPRPKKSTDPFAALFKEKCKEEKTSHGHDDFRRAEQAALKYGKGNLLDEMNDEEEDDPLLWGPNIASLSIQNILTSNSRSLKENSDDIVVPGSQKDKKGKTIIQILEQDKAERRSQGTTDEEPGIRLWTTASGDEVVAMEVDEHLQVPGKSPIIQLLNGSLKRGDTPRSVSILNMCSFQSVNPDERSKLASFLCDMALSSPSPSLADAAGRALTKFWSSTQQPSSSTITTAQVMSCIIRLGADPFILSAHGWQETAQHGGSAPVRSTTLQQLVDLVTACARTNRLRQAETEELALALLLIGTDSRTTPATSRDIVQAIDLTLQCLSPNSSPLKEREFALATRVLQWLSSYQPPTKLRLLSLLSNGSGPSRRIAEFAAYCVVIDKPEPLLEQYNELPSLLEIIDQLQPYWKSDGVAPGKFAVHQHTNYTYLGLHIAILSVAMSNIKGLAAFEQEKKAAASPPPTPKPFAEKPKTDLELVYRALETLHSSISDGRATHLDRSCTKAAIKQLSMNIFYQREFWIKNSAPVKATRIVHYFTKKV
ncbi:hypothetical protein CPB83DRAFT_893485 [Crepidotus variabilis]|uniref:Uncharacterized protein n=1 Tax=Crepidotus variabilis TaxID=179855 RepID=A0A9P6JQZ9_9AGAR|nr:hypothetical protein CPB83DRAFT_893485 [Crepidotus variabilis]